MDGVAGILPEAILEGCGLLIPWATLRLGVMNSPRHALNLGLHVIPFHYPTSAYLRLASGLEASQQKACSYERANAPDKENPSAPPSLDGDSDQTGGAGHLFLHKTYRNVSGAARP